MGVRYEKKPGRPGWDDARIRRELRAYLRERGGQWPSTQQFIADGQQTLLIAISRHGGGPPRRADELACDSREPWTRDRVEAELAEFLSRVGTDRWPRKAEFFAAGRGSLYDAIVAHGGVGDWGASTRSASRCALSTYPRGQKRVRT